MGKKNKTPGRVRVFIRLSFECLRVSAQLVVLLRVRYKPSTYSFTLNLFFPGAFGSIFFILLYIFFLKKENFMCRPERCEPAAAVVNLGGKKGDKTSGTDGV